jgi:hypothetical protein
MQVVKGYQNGYPVPGGLSWTTLPRGLYIRWIGLPGWELGDRPTTYRSKMLTARKPKLWFWYCHTEWIRTGQWKRKNEMRIATWKVHILYKAGAMNEMVK